MSLRGKLVVFFRVTMSSMPFSFRESDPEESNWKTEMENTSEVTSSGEDDDVNLTFRKFVKSEILELCCLKQPSNPEQGLGFSLRRCLRGNMVSSSKGHIYSLKHKN